jgi:predicted PurR-regulated permease PerM
MDYRRNEFGGIELECAKIESIVAGAAIGGLVGMLIGPVATLVCAAVGAQLGYRHVPLQRTQR